MGETLKQSNGEFAGGRVLAEENGGVGLITFNQPEKRNAMSVEMWSGLEQILEAWEKDDAVRVVVLTGAGEKAFISGADISQFEKQRGNAEAQREYERLISGGWARLADFPKPIIARIRGYCLGGGLAIAMQADLRIASEDSQFGIPAARMGITYGLKNVQTLVSLVGPAHARMLLYTAARINSSEAMRIGLVNQVVENEQLSDVVAELARTIAENAPLSVRANKLIIDQVMLDPGERDLEAVKQAGIECLNSKDYREGRAAFMEKRAPRFRGC
jgi:enoyl-CoA hydratase/carnithine racemase